MNPMGKSPFHSAAFQFALNNSPNSINLSQLLSAAQAASGAPTTLPAGLFLPTTSAAPFNLPLAPLTASQLASSNIFEALSQASSTQTSLLLAQSSSGVESTSNASSTTTTHQNQQEQQLLASSLPLPKPTPIPIADDHVFAVPAVPSALPDPRVARRARGCSFCGAISGQGITELTECDCRLVVYCSQEHKRFDWKRHKPACRTSQMRLPRSKTATASLSSQSGGNDGANALNEPMDTTTCSTPPPTLTLPKSTSATSLHSMAASCSSSGFSELSGNSSSASFQQTSSTMRMDTDRLLETDDPDIKIIESKTTAPRKPQKRRRSDEKQQLTPSGKPYKDHSKNVLFKTTLQDHMRSLAASGLALNQHQAIALRLRYIAEHVIRSLNEYGWAVVDNFVGKTHCRYTHMEIEQLYKSGVFKEGQLMDSKEPDITATKDIRSDQIFWFDSADQKAREAVTIRLLVSMIDSVIVHFQGRIPYRVGGRSRAMIACYPGNGSRYVKHVDNPIRDGRCITSIYYCNENWLLSEDGGTLRLYPETSNVPMDIDPQADRLVFFWSDRRNPHEVLPVFRPRYAVTIWYFDHEEKQRAIERQRSASKQQKEDDTHAATEDGAMAVDNSTASRLASLFTADVRAQINAAPIPQRPAPLRRPAAGSVSSSEPSMDSQTVHEQKPQFYRNAKANSYEDEDEDDNADLDVAGDDERPRNYVPDFEV